jgi:GNAT superfamily N-acetyltransferase
MAGAGIPAETIVSGQDADPQELGDVIFRAFEELAPCLYLVPDPVMAKEILPRTLTLDVVDAQRDGAVYTTENRRAVALWVPKSGEPEPEPGRDERVVAAAGAFAGNFEIYHRLVARHYPLGRAYHYLWIAAVDPGSQRRGLGTRLLAAHHDRLDELGMPAYLEAASPRLCTFYRRLGYTEIGEAITLPDGSASIYPMWREPRR